MSWIKIKHVLELLLSHGADGIPQVVLFIDSLNLVKKSNLMTIASLVLEST